MAKIKQLLIIGNIGATNTGDEAILEGTLEILKKHFPEITPLTFSATPEQTELRHGVASFHFFPSGIRSLIKNGLKFYKQLHSLRTVGHVFLGGGGLFTDDSSIHAPIIWGIQALAIHIILRKPYSIYAQSVGPLHGQIARLITKEVYKRAQHITVRDSQSRELIATLLPEQAENIHIVTDPALFLQGHIEPKKHWETLNHHPAFPEDIDHEIPLPSSSKINDKTRIALSLRPWKDGQQTYGQLISALQKIHTTIPIHVELIPMQYVHEEDISILEGIQRQLQQHGITSTIHSIHEPKKLILFLQSCSLAIGMRLHFIILSYLAAIPLFALPYSSKITSLLEDFNEKEAILSFPGNSEEIFMKLKKVLSSSQVDYSSQRQQILEVKKMHMVEILKHILQPTTNM